jgi:hypothetical protein
MIKRLGTKPVLNAMYVPLSARFVLRGNTQSVELITDQPKTNEKYLFRIVKSTYSNYSYEAHLNKTHFKTHL